MPEYHAKPTTRHILPAKGAFYLAALAPGAWAVLALLELITKMGRGTGMYADYGRNTGEVIVAFGLLVAEIFWLIIGTALAFHATRNRVRLLWTNALITLTSSIVASLTLVFLLGVGHS